MPRAAPPRAVISAVSASPQTMTTTFFLAAQDAASLPYRPTATPCRDCRLRAACLPRHLSEAETACLGDAIDTRIRLKRGDVLFEQGASHDAVFAVRMGSLKTQWRACGNPDQVAGFHIPGDLLDFSGLFDRRHATTALALENTEVCVIRLEALDALGLRFPRVPLLVRGLMSAELARLQRLMALARLRAEQRLAAFLLDLSDRYAALGYAADRFCLRMTYGDIGSLLGMTLATVSRLLGQLARDTGLVIHARQVEITDRQALRAVAGGACLQPRPDRSLDS